MKKTNAEENVVTVYDRAITYVKSILSIEAEYGLIAKDSIENITTEVITLVLKTNPFSTLSDTKILDTYIIQYLSTYITRIDIDLKNLPEIFDTRNTLYSICVMKVMGYDVTYISEHLSISSEELNYAIDIIKSNKIIEWK